MKSSVEFKWNPKEFDALLRTCLNDDSVALSIKNLPNKRMNILEAGCGSGRVVKYLFDLGYKNVHGIELNPDAVRHINTIFPELQIVQGDILKMPYPDNFFDAVLSYGVVEHFPDSVIAPMKSLFNVIKPGGVAVITVPCQNKIRSLIARLKLGYLHPKTVIRVIKKTVNGKANNDKKLYYAHPLGGAFFEYRLTPQEFIQISTTAGFEILESTPIAHIDGIYHLLGSPLVRFDRWKFKVSAVGRLLNNFLLRYPFMHNHMHACVLRKPLDSSK